MPPALEDLFLQLLTESEDEDHEMRTRFFYWVILGGELRLREWRHILPFLEQPPPTSLQQMRRSKYYAETDEQLEKLIRHMSMGLVQVVGQIEPAGRQPREPRLLLGQCWRPAP